MDDDAGPLEDAVSEVINRINSETMFGDLYGTIAFVHGVDESAMRAEIRKRRGWKPLKKRTRRSKQAKQKEVELNFLTAPIDAAGYLDMKP